MPEVLVEEARRFMEDSLTAVGAPVSEAKAQADLLIHADTVGHYSHGLNRLGIVLLYFALFGYRKSSIYGSIFRLQIELSETFLLNLS